MANRYFKREAANQYIYYGVFPDISYVVEIQENDVRYDARPTTKTLTDILAISDIEEIDETEYNAYLTGRVGSRPPHHPHVA